MQNSRNNYYNKNLKEYARKLRNESTLPEVILWQKLLKGKQLRGYQFLRQRPIEKYIVDFFCKELKLIIEVDGEYHKFQKKKDKVRDEDLRNLGFTVLHFKNEDVLKELSNVFRTLDGFINEFENCNSNQH